MSNFKLALIVLSCAGFYPSSIAQQPASSLPVYDAVVIKLNKGVSGNTSVNMNETTFQAENVSLKHLLVNAYGIRESLIVGLPGWANSARYDITAKVTDPDMKQLRSISRDEQQAMLAAILSERFQIKEHTEVKTLPVYELVIAKGGSKLKLSAVAPDDAANPNHPGNMDVHNTEMTARGVLLSDLAGNLSYPLDVTVIDKTGLTGRYDFQLQWTADGADTGAADAPPNIFTAIQEQLGLKLEPAKGPVKTLVIDHVEQPTEN